MISFYRGNTVRAIVCSLIFLSFIPQVRTLPGEQVLFVMLKEEPSLLCKAWEAIKNHKDLIGWVVTTALAGFALGADSEDDTEEEKPLEKDNFSSLRQLFLEALYSERRSGEFDYVDRWILNSLNIRNFGSEQCTVSERRHMQLLIGHYNLFLVSFFSGDLAKKQSRLELISDKLEKFISVYMDHTLKLYRKGKSPNDEIIRKLYAPFLTMLYKTINALGNPMSHQVDLTIYSAFEILNDHVVELPIVLSLRFTPCDISTFTKAERGLLREHVIRMTETLTPLNTKINCMMTSDDGHAVRSDFEKNKAKTTPGSFGS